LAGRQAVGNGDGVVSAVAKRRRDEETKRPRDLIMMPRSAANMFGMLPM